MIRVIPLGPEWTKCAESHCIHLEAKGLFCCRCPVRVPGWVGVVESLAHQPLTSFDVLPTEPEKRPYMKRMPWPWPCQMGRCGGMASDDQSYYCDNEGCVGEHNPGEPSYVVGLVVS